MFKNFIFNSREKCPCTSGKLYKDCCKVKKPKEFHSQGEFLHLVGKMMKKSRIKVCLYNGCTAKGKNIIGAHALQENRILSKLQIDRQVYMQDFSSNPEMLEIEKGKPEPFFLLKKVYIKDATVATCFCKEHDDSIFAKIEKSQYSLDELNDEQLFLFAYKTFTFELYKEIAAQKFQENMFANVPQTTKNWGTVYQYRNTVSKLEDLNYYKDYFDKAIKEQDHGGIETMVIEIPYRIQFENYMMVAPPFDIKGRKIKCIDKATKRMKFAFFTTFPDESKSYILVSVLKKDLDIYGQYFDQIRNSPIGLIEYYLNAFIPLYSQNLIISPELWDSWSELGQSGIQFAVADPNSVKLLKGVQFYMQNIAKLKDNNEIKIDTTNMPFNFFIPYAL
ncbi:SEC-C domain-containing protein [Asaccharospora irregularis]|uniref:SEC-C motif-containing protein n=1 Tax=Asaccharospora irregularis DSM 2635 TaxID=1121321 RepID=A0A1M5PQV3_9FIRM|nr:SEC-C domain-containing protein [Asaccharospora irregularis]SHH04118.1 hypothetical protein SAMN04488530_11557 [Asaccharospora irregularis DSM 2635]